MPFEDEEAGMRTPSYQTCNRMQDLKTHLPDFLTPIPKLRAFRILSHISPDPDADVRSKKQHLWPDRRSDYQSYHVFFFFFFKKKCPECIIAMGFSTYCNNAALEH